MSSGFLPGPAPSGSESPPEIQGAMATNLGSTETVAFDDTEERWLVGTFSADLAVTVTGVEAGARLVIMATQGSGGPYTLSVNGQSVQIPTSDGALATVTVRWIDGDTFNVESALPPGAGGEEAATAPGAPLNLAATPGDTEVDLDWDAPASDGGDAITDYVVQYRTPAGSGSYTTFTDGTSTTTATTVTGLTNDSEYEFRVAAVNGVGTGSYSTTDTATPAAAPEVPAILSGATLIVDPSDESYTDGTRNEFIHDQSGNSKDFAGANTSEYPSFKDARFNASQPAFVFNDLAIPTGNVQNDWVKRTTSLPLTSGDYTVAALLNPGSDTIGVDGTIYSQRSSTDGGTAIYAHLALDTTIKPFLRHRNNASAITTINASGAISGPTTLIAVLNGTSLKLYADGAEVASGTISAGAVTTDVAGIGNNPIGADYFVGDVGYLAVIPDAATTGDVADLHAYMSGLGA